MGFDPVEPPMTRREGEMAMRIATTVIFAALLSSGAGVPAPAADLLKVSVPSVASGTPR
jgi:hypothetical protein